MDDRVLAMWAADTCYATRLETWWPGKLIAQAAEIDAVHDECERQRAEIAQQYERHCAENKSMQDEIERLDEIIRKQAERIAFLTPVHSDYVGDDE